MAGAPSCSAPRRLPVLSSASPIGGGRRGASKAAGAPQAAPPIMRACYRRWQAGHCDRAAGCRSLPAGRRHAAPFSFVAPTLRPLRLRCRRGKESAVWGGLPKRDGAMEARRHEGPPPPPGCQLAHPGARPAQRQQRAAGARRCLCCACPSCNHGMGGRRSACTPWEHSTTPHLTKMRATRV